jgi:hypothetical protein
MKLPVIIIILFVVLLNNCIAEQPTLKEQAKNEFKNEHFNEAIELLKKATFQTPDDAELYYLLGFYCHYNAYDSRPLIGYNSNYSNQVFEYLDKALELNPNYGDAKYFYGAECSANAFFYMQRYQADSLKYIYQKAYNKGAYPEWLIEFGKNMLESCEPNAILFAGGNPDFDVWSYLQLIQHIRTDITIAPIGFIDRPYYVGFLKNGLPGAVKSVKIDITEEQIQNIRPFKWDTTTINIPVTDELVNKYNLSAGATMDFTLCPDLFSDRSKQENRSRKRSFLSPQRAVLMSIIESNQWSRPIYFSNGADGNLLGGLDEYLQNCGLVSKLMPFKTEKTGYAVDIRSHEQLLLSDKNFRDYKSILISDIPRISGMINLYFMSYMNLAQQYKEDNNYKRIEALHSFFGKYLKIGFNSEMEDNCYNQIEKMMERE